MAIFSSLRSLCHPPYVWRGAPRCSGPIAASRREGRLAQVLLLSLAVFAQQACTYHGPSQDNPLQRRFTWYSYLNGDDLRRACVPGSPATYRMVYNGVYVQQVRTYDITPSGAGADRADMRVRVRGPVQLNEVTIRLQASTFFDDVTAPWQGTVDSVPLTGADLVSLDKALAESGVFRPAPKGLLLRGEDFFWIVGACIDGTFHFNAFKWDSAAFAALTFPRLLLAWDPTGVPLNPPRSLSPFDIYRQTASDGGNGPTYTLTVGDNGLFGVKPLF